MSTRSNEVDRNVALRALDGLTAVMAAAFTLFTIYYGIFTLTNLSFAGISLRQYLVGTPGLEMFLFDERAEYVVLFLGWGLAVYYFDYARKKLTEQFEPDADDDSSDAPETVTLVDDLGLRSERVSKVTRKIKTAYGRVDPYLALVLGALALATMGYIYMEFSRLQGDAFILGFNSTDHAVGLALIVLVTDATRRAFGWIIASVGVLAIIYMHQAVSPALPGLLGHSGDNFIGIIEEAALGLQSGVYDSTIMGIGSTWVAIFIMFAGMAKAYGLMDFVREVGIELGGTLRTGVVQIAVISSMIMGSITGSAAANTATTGSFTIPMIKDQGVRDDYAASIEAVASAGGQMLPPVMGVAAFLMADILGIPYLEVIRAGAIPAALFYFSVFVAVHFTILKFGWTSDELSSFDWRILAQGWHFAIPMGVLLTTLVYLGFTPMSAGLYTIFSMIGVIALKNIVARLLNRGSGDQSYEVNSISKQTANGLTQGGLEMAPLVGVLSAMGLIVNLLETSGLTGRLGSGIIGFADVTIFGFTGGLALVLILTMIASIAFGLGMPTPAAYILVAFLVVGAATELGVPDLTAHMFVFYFAMLSAITPPVAISVAVGSRIAESSFLSSCVQALRLGAPGFVIPFAFVANNELIEWTAMTPFAFPVVLAGTIALIVATIGFDGANSLSAPVRLVYIVVGFAAMFGSVLAGGMVGIGIQAVAALAVVLSLIRARYVVGYDVERAKNSAASD